MKIFDVKVVTLYSFLDDVVSSPITISAFFSTPLESFKYNLSEILAPIVYPCIIDVGGFDWSSYPLRYNLFSFPCFVIATSIGIQKTLSSVLISTAFGTTIEVINDLSSFSNASLLNPVELSANCPKFEFEFVILKSPPLSASKCLVNPIANTETT